MKPVMSFIVITLHRACLINLAFAPYEYESLLTPTYSPEYTKTWLLLLSSDQCGGRRVWQTPHKWDTSLIIFDLIKTP